MGDRPAVAPSGGGCGWDGKKTRLSFNVRCRPPSWQATATFPPSGGVAGTFFPSGGEMMQAVAIQQFVTQEVALTALVFVNPYSHSIVAGGLELMS
jgi:hypothetical protein